LQFPFFIANFYSFPYIQRPEFRDLKALHLDFQIGAVSFFKMSNNRTFFKAPQMVKAQILQTAKYCPNLEHLGVSLIYIAEWDLPNYVVNIPSLVALHQFRQLSSLDISIEFLRFQDIHKVIEFDHSQ
jgi:hypothetical protein